MASRNILNIEKPMPRFQALTDAVLDGELDALRRQLGLRRSQKAELLRQITALASWVVQQSAEGCVIRAQRGKRVQQLQRPALDRMREERLRTRAGPEGEVADIDEAVNSPRARVWAAGACMAGCSLISVPFAFAGPP